MKYINFEENRKIGQKVSLKKSDGIGYKKRRLLELSLRELKRISFLLLLADCGDCNNGYCASPNECV